MAPFLIMATTRPSLSQDIDRPDPAVEGSDTSLIYEEETYETMPEIDSEFVDTLSEGMGEFSDTMTAGGITPNATFSSLMSQNMREMMDAELSGQIDQDYAKLMAEHHKGAIQMAELYLVSGTDDQLIQMAENMINRKAEEYEKLLSFSDEYPSSVEDQDKTKLLLDPMQRMNDRQQGREMTEDMEKDFVSMMLDHSKSGIEMSEIEMYKGTNAEVKELAREIKEGQNKDLEQLEKWQE
ncbi:MAG TPA: DUF305 domain-containing protein [Cytophagales bacterium]|nr:DUF305 domain-containing protein [Cytophagales bacterium]